MRVGMGVGVGVAVRVMRVRVYGRVAGNISRLGRVRSRQIRATRYTPRAGTRAPRERLEVHHPDVWVSRGSEVRRKRREGGTHAKPAWFLDPCAFPPALSCDRYGRAGDRRAHGARNADADCHAPDAARID